MTIPGPDRILRQLKPWHLYCWPCHKLYTVAYEYRVKSGQVIPLSRQLHCGHSIPLDCLSAWERELHEMIKEETHEFVSASCSAASALPR